MLGFSQKGSAQSPRLLVIGEVNQQMKDLSPLLLVCFQRGLLATDSVPGWPGAGAGANQSRTLLSGPRMSGRDPRTWARQSSVDFSWAINRELDQK